MLDGKLLIMLSRARLATKRSLKMIIPTPEFDPLFADDGIPFRTKMLGYIEQEFSDILGDRCSLLGSDRGLEQLAELVADQPNSASPQDTTPARAAA